MYDPLEQFKLQVSEVLNLAEQALAQKKAEEQRAELERQRVERLKQCSERVQRELNLLRVSIQETLDKCSYLGQDDPVVQKIEAQLAEVDANIADPRAMAEQLYAQEEQEQLLALEDQELENQLLSWRKDLAQDLLETINAAPDYFSASDLAITLREHRQDLLAVGLFERLVERLIQRLNQLDSLGKVIEVRGSVQSTLDWMANFALDQRRARGIPAAKVRQTNRKEADPLQQYTDLVGKIVIFGGHKNMYEGVSRRLANSPHLDLRWFHMEQTDTQVSGRAEVVKGADIVILVTAYASHKFQDLARTACERYSVPLEYLNTVGIKSTLDFICAKLMLKDLQRKYPER